MQLAPEAQNYSVRSILGNGSFAIVYEAIDQRNNQKVAIKEINKEKFSVYNPDTQKLFQLFDQEISILESLNHPNIIKLLEVIRTQQHIYLIFEYCMSDLEAFVRKHQERRLTEEQAKPIIYQIARALHELSEKNIVHRDLKLQNILINDQQEIKLADFGFARLKEEQQVLQSHCGTPLTMAPEILKNVGYGKSCDIWSLGVILYQIITGSPPFIGADKKDIINNIEKSSYSDIPFKTTIEISDCLKGLIRRMLTINPNNRISTKEILDHSWFSDMIQSEAGIQLMSPPAQGLVKFLQKRYDFVTKVRKAIIVQLKIIKNQYISQKLSDFNQLVLRFQMGGQLEILKSNGDLVVLDYQIGPQPANKGVFKFIDLYTEAFELAVELFMEAMKETNPEQQKVVFQTVENLLPLITEMKCSNKLMIDVDERLGSEIEFNLHQHLKIFISNDERLEDLLKQCQVQLKLVSEYKMIQPMDEAINIFKQHLQLRLS